ncbi:DNA-binding NarL/FixJ family response regulator [Kribbella rubisoli]|uniref:DNA-binding NarL/FixJ family response regulator n=1 Tax=Kribbella rubisoli TaxID=3075929 RepID=A0A4Q7XB01_9ACTN|nr:LuxR C-terminal-related transcriptional regulator [Kribbella rubisoli]RZU19935.1 DNA-binding NarL/FixJ family response regulator [Kribbella rubisoli]
MPIGKSEGVLRIDAETAIILREAYHKIEALNRSDHHGLYDYVRAVACKLARVDTFYIGFLQGSNRVRYPYGYDSGKFDDPATHTYGPNGQTAWLLKHQQTYRFAYDNGMVLNAGVPCGDTSKQSADAVTVPLFRQNGQLLGMISMQSYQPDSYDDNAVRAFEWLAETVARVVAREDEDRQALRLLPAGEDTPNVLTSDHVMEYLSNQIALLRMMAADAMDAGEMDAAVEERLAGLIRTAERTQSELIEMMLDVDEGPERRFISLTRAQQGVAILLVEGYDNDQLATELGVSPNTVKSHLSTILRKYELDSRAQVADDVRRYLAG